MPIEYIWMVSAEGVPYRIPAIQDPRCISEIEWEQVPCSTGSSIRTIVASSTAAFSIDRSGKVLVLVLPSHIAIRERVEIYVNQRWYPIVNWSRPFLTDRSRFSDETGMVSKDPSFNEVTDGWSWEEPWGTHLDPRSYDKEGWQYSFSFLGAKWDRQCKKTHFVRRKMLKRHMRYTAHDQWVELFDDDSRMFTELAIGGTDVFTGECLLFALGTDGNVYRRSGIQANRPSGCEWEKVPKIQLKGMFSKHHSIQRFPEVVTDSEVDDVTLITVSPSLPTLLCVTWDGKMFSRSGISPSFPCGLTWQNLSTPRNKAVICAAIGKHTLWCVTADGSLWYSRVEVDEKRKEHVMESITANGYQLVTQGGICKISVTKHDQVFCVSTKEKIEARTGIDPGEPSGKRFEKLVDRGEPTDQRWISMYAGAVSFSQIPEYFLSSSSLQSKIEVLQFKKADWRLKIIERLQEASERSWATMNNVKGAEVGTEVESGKEKEEEHVKRVRCQLKSGDTFQSVNISITSTHIEISGNEKIQKTIELSSVKSVLPTFQRLPQKYLLNMFIGAESECYCFAFTDEKTRGSFQGVLEAIIREHICSATRSSYGETMWTVSNEGVLRWHCLAEMSKESKYEKRVNPGASRGLVVDGNFQSIDCGAKRLVWAINESGALYSMCSQFDPLNSHETQHDYKMTDMVTLKMIEYQKHAIFRGFITFQGSQRGISAWMCDGKPCPPSFSSLPSANWSWADATWQLDEETWKYANEIDGVYLENEKEQGKARRRVWSRRARFELNKSPWCHVEGPPVQCVRVAKRESPDGKIIVIALTKDGHILKRNGVDREHFTGTNWTQILADSPISSIHLQWEDQTLWCATTDILIMSRNLRQEGGNGFLPASDWRHLDMDLGPITHLAPNTLKTIELTGYSNVLYARISNILYRIDTKHETISDAYPMDNLQQAVVNAQGSICVRGANITVIRDWRVVPYTDRKATIIAMQNVERATNMGRGLKNVAFY